MTVVLKTKSVTKSRVHCTYVPKQHHNGVVFLFLCTSMSTIYKVSFNMLILIKIKEYYIVSTFWARKIEGPQPNWHWSYWHSYFARKLQKYLVKRQEQENNNATSEMFSTYCAMSYQMHLFFNLLFCWDDEF